MFVDEEGDFAVSSEEPNPLTEDPLEYAAKKSAYEMNSGSFEHWDDLLDVLKFWKGMTVLHNLCSSYFCLQTQQHLLIAWARSCRLTPYILF